MDLPGPADKVFQVLDSAFTPALNPMKERRAEDTGEHVGEYSTRFKGRVVSEMARVAAMPGGLPYVLSLHLRFQLECVHNMDVCFDNTEQNDSDSRHIANRDANEVLLPLLYAKRGDFKLYLDAAAASRRIRAAMETFTCGHFQHRGRPCIHGNLLVVLDELQKRAWGEVGARAMMAVGKRVPRELAELVREWARAMEEVPHNPSIFEKGNSMQTTREWEMWILGHRKESGNCMSDDR